MTKYSELVELFSLNKNYKNYREALQAARLPIIPYLGIRLSQWILWCDTQTGQAEWLHKAVVDQWTISDVTSTDKYYFLWVHDNV